MSARPVEVVIACHTPERPIGRAVRSVLHGNEEDASVLVVCHNVSREDIAAAIDPMDRDQVRFAEHRDGHRSASGPFNAGFANGDSPFVAIMGSDDTLAPGAVASWLRVRRRTGAQFVITRLALGSRTNGVPTPAVRMLRSGRVDLVRDRLSYRSAPLGLIDRAALRASSIGLVEGAAVGGDVEMVTRMMHEWPVAYDRFGPPYVIGEDAGDRVTYVVRPIEEQLGFVGPLLGAPWFRSAPPEVHHAIVVKFLRIHVFGAVFYRDRAEIWTPNERAVLARQVRDLLAAAPSAPDVLSRADRDLMDACLDPAVPASQLIARARARRRHGRPSTVFPRRLEHILRREAPLRFMAASSAVRVLPRLRR
jgi:hypothetical protein